MGGGLARVERRTSKKKKEEDRGIRVGVRGVGIEIETD